jgi:hypothetical protein
MAAQASRPRVNQPTAVFAQLIERVRRIAVDLSYKSDCARSCNVRLTLDESADLTVLDRLRLGDREAIYDAIVEASRSLDELRELIGCELSGSDIDVLGRMAAIRQANDRSSCLDEAVTDRGRRSVGQPARHG